MGTKEEKELTMETNLQVICKVDGKEYGKSGILHSFQEAKETLKRIAEDIKQGDMMQDIKTTRICHFGFGEDFGIPSHIKTDNNALFVRVQRCELIDRKRKNVPSWLKTFEVVIVNNNN